MHIINKQNLILKNTVSVVVVVVVYWETQQAFQASLRVPEILHGSTAKKRK